MDAPAPPSHDEILACLRTLEALHRLGARALAQVPDVGRVLAAGYSLARRAGRARRDASWRRPGAPETPRRPADESRTRYHAQAAELAPDSATLRDWESASARDPSEEPGAEPAGDAARATGGPARGERTLRCNMCGEAFRGSAGGPGRCPACDELAARKRAQRADLAGRAALVTGARVRIGYAVARALLRAGAEVYATTRFAGAALARYAAEPDYASWAARLHLRELDLCDLRAVERFARDLCARGAPLDVLINNAARTLDHPRAWHDAMRARDRGLFRALADGAELRALGSFAAPALARDAVRALPSGATTAGALALDAEGQPRDDRARNAWRARVGEVPLAELLAVHAVGALAPFVLIDQLRAAMARGDGRARFVVNVTSAEGKFYRRYKGPWHPHTNMAKAALNMLTRTCAAELAREGVYVCAVDPGWVSEQNPVAWAERVRGPDARLPVDVEDAAARVLDPVYSAVNGAPPVHGVLLEHFRPAAW